MFWSGFITGVVTIALFSIIVCVVGVCGVFDKWDDF